MLDKCTMENKMIPKLDRMQICGQSLYHLAITSSVFAISDKTVYLNAITTGKC